MSIENSDRRTVLVLHYRQGARRLLSRLGKRNAEALGLGGWVRNRRDGAVEALFSGAASQVFEMLARCRQGPPAAFVEDVAIIEDGSQTPSGFRVLPTA